MSVAEPDAPADAPAMTAQSNARLSALRFGFTSLALWAAFGIGLELAHALKVAAFYEDDLARLLLRLAHAHGTLMALVVIVHGIAVGAAGARPLRIGAALAPLGFLFGAIAHPEGDPSLGIALVPVGALAFVLGLALSARAVWRPAGEPEADLRSPAPRDH